MLIIYTAPSCTSCRKAKAWLIEHEIPHIDRNVFTTPLDATELKALLALSENGTEDLISERSKVYKKLNIDFDSLSMKELLSIVQENPSLLRRPIIADDKRLLIGFNEEEIRVFLPRKIKQMEQMEARLKAGL